MGGQRRLTFEERRDLRAEIDRLTRERLARLRGLRLDVTARVEHGVAAYYHQGCRCAYCRDAARGYRRGRAA